MRGEARAVVLAMALCGAAGQAAAQFQLPPAPGSAPPASGVPSAAAAVQPMPGRLTVQYGYGSESAIEYRRNRDLDRRVRDDSTIATPQINGFILYRPTNWLETTLEVIAEREIALKEERSVTLPSGEIQTAPKRRASLLIDQAFFRIHQATAPFEFSVGRKNYEDERHWLYDTSMDIASVAARLGRFRAEVWAGREALADLDLAPQKREPRDRIDTLITYLDYRFEDARVGAYMVNRHDRAGAEGHPRLFGVRAHGAPSDQLSYWGELATVRGKDELRRRFNGVGRDVGFTYRVTSIPWYPNVTVGYASGTGDATPDDERNSEFRQTGLHSNEHRFAGVSKFKVYGEALDPELSNLKILTSGFGFRPSANVSVDIVVHRYRLDEISDEVRNSALTALANQAGESKDVGKGLDIVVGVRRAFGIRRLGMDFRVGWFSPGRAFLRNEGTEDEPDLRRPQKAVAFITKIWW